MNQAPWSVDLLDGGGVVVTLRLPAQVEHFAALLQRGKQTLKNDSRPQDAELISAVVDAVRQAEERAAETKINRQFLSDRRPKVSEAPQSSYELNAREAARILGRDERTVTRRCADGRYRTARRGPDGRSWLVSRVEIEADARRAG